MLQLEHELVISLPGFIMCMLHALAEPMPIENSDLVLTAERIMERTELIVGTSCFYGEIWKTMLRSQRCCLEAIKYLKRKIPKTLKDAAKLAQRSS